MQDPNNQLHRFQELLAAISFFLLLALCPLRANAQAFGTISGNVTDPTGAVVPGASVTVTETGTTFTRSATSDSSGHYVIPNLRAND